jgi:hypothetical protein
MAARAVTVIALNFLLVIMEIHLVSHKDTLPCEIRDQERIMGTIS